MSIVKTSAKGQVVIPKREREKVGIKPGTRVIAKVVEDHIEIRPLPENPADSFCGVYKNGPSLTKALLRERKRDFHREGKSRS